VLSYAKAGAGLILFRRVAGELQVLLVHPGGPYFARKDVGAWSIPKGEYADGEDPQAVALREFEEETESATARASPGLGRGASGWGQGRHRFCACGGP
jgi:predicted NUDIX family NTP pyrophosphohydrolase